MKKRNLPSHLPTALHPSISRKEKEGKTLLIATGKNDLRRSSAVAVVITAQLLLLGTMVVAHANLSGTYGGDGGVTYGFSSSSSIFFFFFFSSHDVVSPLFRMYAHHLSYASLRRDDGAQHCARNSPNFFTKSTHHVHLFKRARTM